MARRSPLLDHGQGLGAFGEPHRRAERLKLQQRPDVPFDGSMIFFDKVVQVLRLARLNVETAVGDQLSNGGRVVSAVDDRDLLGHGVQVDRALKELSADGALAIRDALAAAPTAKAGQLRGSVAASSPDNQTDKGLRNEVEAVQVHGRVRCRWQLASQEADQFGSNKRRRLALRKMANAF